MGDVSLDCTNVEDWSVVMEICDKVNGSDSEAKEASKALRKDIQFGRPAVQLSAARLWAILMRNCAPYFVAQTTNRKFLGKIEEVALSPTTSPVVRDRLVEVIGTSVYLLRDSKNLKPYQSTWKKLRLQLKLNHPIEGLEIPADDPILNPTPHRPPSSLRNLPPNEPVQPDVMSNVAAVTQGLNRVELEPAPVIQRRNTRDGDRERRRERVHNVESTYGVISPEEDMRRLFEECEIARDNCRILADSLVYATPESVTSNTVIKEFRQKCMKSQEIIGAQIDWATSVADRARAEQLTVNGPGEIAPTVEEQLLQALVMATTELNDVFKTYDDLERIAISEREEAEVRARSKVELRLDRTKYQQLEGGDVYMIPQDNHGPSRSQTHTPAPAQNHTPAPAQNHTPLPGHTRRPLPQPTPSSPHVNSLAPPPPAPHGPRPLSRNRTPSPNLGSDVRDPSTDDSSQESELPPTMPSEKAMGKRRAEPPVEDEGMHQLTLTKIIFNVGLVKKNGRITIVYTWIAGMVRMRMESRNNQRFSCTMLRKRGRNRELVRVSNGWMVVVVMDTTTPVYFNRSFFLQTHEGVQGLEYFAIALGEYTLSTTFVHILETTKPRTGGLTNQATSYSSAGHLFST
ncbi:hypothetical protein B0J17DRAFT_49260 [Rhizoctonia solani]|nr:hypothetical protein B0J17DRAFT_49260 [Rhizoctonia solani]